MGKTLLLADDSVTIQKVVGISFANEDIVITTVDNGDDAISRAREMRPDVILADVVMPGKSGYEVCEAVKADPNLQHIPVLLLTGTFEAFDEERASRAGAAGQVAKPFEAHTLVERVKELLAQAPSAPPQAATTPTPTPVPEAMPRPTPAAAGPENAFDFFDEPVASEAPAAAAPAPPAASERPELEIEGPDTAFAFGEDELGNSSTEVLERVPALPPAAHTVAILPDGVSSEDEAREAAFDSMSPPAPPIPSAPPPVPQSVPAPTESYDFEFEGVSSDAPAAGPHGLAESTLLDSNGDSPYDVSSSEIGDLSAPRKRPSETAAPTKLLETPFPGAAAAPGGEPSPSDPMPSFGQDPVMEMLSSDPVDSGSVTPSDAFVEEHPTAAPSRAGDPMAIPPPSPAEPSEWPAALERPEFAMREPEPAISEPEPMPEPPISEPEAMPEPAISEPEPMPEPAMPEPMPEPEPAGETALSDDALAQIAPALQEQLHETLEKIAWEAFGQVTEKVIEQSVERLEKIAWEVVPKLAETLIAEEIRKLKGK